MPNIVFLPGRGSHSTGVNYLVPLSLPLCSVLLGPGAGKLLFPRVPYELGSTSNLVGDWKETSILVLTLTGAGAVVVAVAIAARKCVPGQQQPG